MNTDFDRIKDDYLPLRDVVFNTLRDAILSGQLAPGERLLENQLSEKLGVSRTPVREALRKLEIENLVEMAPRKGAQVSQISEGDMKNVLEIRACLEALAARLACQKIKPEHIRELKGVREEFAAAVAVRDLEKMAEADENFHNVIYKSAENDKLVQIIQNLRTQIYRYRIAYLQEESALPAIDQEHQDLIEAVAQQDRDKASKIAEQHIINQEKAVIKKIASIAGGVK